MKRAWGPAFSRQGRDLTPEGLTKPGHAAAVDDRGPGKVVVIIPCHNEELAIAEALESLAAQTRLVDEVVVIADRCSDETVPIALAHGAIAFTTIRNKDNKAGAVNQALSYLLPRLSDRDAVLAMDGDSSLAPTFVAMATRRLRQPRGGRGQVGAVGGIFLGYPVRGLIGHIQNNEYVRYAGEIRRRGGRADVITGTASLFSVRALRHVAVARFSGRLPPGPSIYDVDALTEDNELTLALKHLGYRCVSPRECVVGTELMPSLKRLFYQRLRWQRGAVGNLLAYGLTRQTLPYVVRQIMTYVTLAFLPFFLTTLAYNWTATGSVPWSWFWVFVTMFIVFERVWSVRQGGWRSILLAGLVLPEAVYDLFLHGVYVKALIDVANNRRGTWGSDAPAERFGRRSLRHVAAPACVAALLLADIGLALVLNAIGVAWTAMGVFVLSGALLAVVRLSGLDPLRLLLGSGELERVDHPRAAAPQSFGGEDVPKAAASESEGDTALSLYEDAA
jgi:poly-beta-1,6-N-acetyl-D-glucosamine synthase